MLKTFFTSAGAFLLALCLLMSAFELSATDADLYYDTQIECGVDAGILDEQMRNLDEKLADYLGGNAGALDDAVLFNAKEISHMRDVYRLFDYLRAAIYLSLAGAVALLMAGLIPSGDRRRRLKIAAIVGPACLYVPIALLAAYCALDFDAAFEAMHKLLFTNDLWLLSPETDLMIRMLPEEFFVSLSGKLALRALLVSLAAPLALWAFSVDMGIFSGIKKHTP